MIDYHVSVTRKFESYKVVEIGDFIISLRACLKSRKVGKKRASPKFGSMSTKSYPQTWAKPSGIYWKHYYQTNLPLADRVNTRCMILSRQYCTFFMKDVAGVRCRRSIRRGRPCTIGFASGAKMEHLSIFDRYLLTESVNNRFAVLKQALLSLIPKRLKQPPMLIAIADMIAQKSKDANAVSLPIPKGSCLRWSSPPLQAPKTLCGFWCFAACTSADSVRTVWCDAGFKVTLIALALSLWQITLEVIRPTKRFHTLKRRWVVERTFAWLSSARRLAKTMSAYLSLIKHLSRWLWFDFASGDWRKNDFPNSLWESSLQDDCRKTKDFLQGYYRFGLELLSTIDFI